MSQDILTAEVLQKYTSEESALVERIHRLETELGDLHTRLQEVRLIRKALEGAGADDVQPRVAPVSLSLPREAEKGVSDAVPPSMTPTVDLPPGGRRKGRRQVTGSVRISDLGIVEAAIELARQRGIREADAGQILEWFKEAGYRGRQGLPTRNSIYVSLNREFQESAPGTQRVTRPSRGRFKFHY